MMTHQQIQENELIERYVRRQLGPEERRAFQEHYFECEECFEAVQTAARFIAGVRQSARTGVLAQPTVEKAPWWAWLFQPAMGAAAAAILLLAAAAGWFYLSREARSTGDLTRGATPSGPSAGTPLLEKERAPAPTSTPAEPEKPQELLARNHAPEELAPRSPAILLESARGGGGNQVTLPANVRAVILRIEVEPGAAFTSYQFQVLDNAKRAIATASSGRANARGAVAASLSAEKLQSGTYRVRWFGVRDGQRELIGESDLTILRQ
ncbi:MAG: zf-HC2 domain-containing protein [Blastocatellia bacterium]|nr:zf-HC2 domain-containing protein [Blastocatellia bacterium]